MVMGRTVNMHVPEHTATTSVPYRTPAIAGCHSVCPEGLESRSTDSRLQPQTAASGHHQLLSMRISADDANTNTEDRARGVWLVY